MPLPILIRGAATALKSPAFRRGAAKLVAGEALWEAGEKTVKLGQKAKKDVERANRAKKYKKMRRKKSRIPIE